MRPIDITLGKERLDDGSLGHTVAIGGVSLLANDEASARVLAIELVLTIHLRTGEVARIVEPAVNRRIAA